MEQNIPIGISILKARYRNSFSQELSSSYRMWEWFIVYVHIYNQNCMGGTGRTWRITVRKLEGEGVETKLHDLAVTNLPNPHSYMILAS